MATKPREYGWEIVFRNDRMGFVRTIELQTTTMWSALDQAVRALEEMYPDTVHEFYAISAKRGREVGT